MSQKNELQHITRCLSAAGYAKSQDGKETYLLWVNAEKSHLQWQQWSGDSMTRQALVVKSVRPNSTAAYLTTRTDKVVICITPSSSLASYTYDQDEREWIESDDTDIDALPPFVAHSLGKLAATVDTRGRIHLVFQDQSQQLTYAFLDKSWSSVTISANPVIASPLAISFIKNDLHIYFISAKDNFVHDLFGAKDSWKDKIVAKQAFGTTLKNFVRIGNEKDGKDLYLLTQDDALLVIGAEGRPMKLGTVKMGKFESERQGDQIADEAWNGTLTAESLKGYLAKDPTCLNVVGGEHSVTPLAAACIRGHLEVVRILLRSKANPNALSPQKRTPLFYATSTSESRDRRAIVRALLDAGANVDECYAENGFTTPLMNAISIISDQDIVDELLKHGASPNAKDVAGQNVETLAQGTPMESVVADKVQEGSSSPFERQIVEFMVAFLMLVVAYSNSKRVKDVVEQITEQIMIRFKELNVGNEEKASSGPQTSGSAMDTSNAMQLVKP